MAAPKRKIGFLFDDSLDKTGGVQEYMLSLGRYLARQGHEVQYIVGSTKRTDIPGVRSLSRNIRVKFNGNYMTIPLPTSRRKIRELLATEQYDVLHVQMPHSPWMAHRVITAAPSSTAVIGTFHIVPISKLVSIATRGLALWTRHSVQRLDQLLSVSTAAQAYVQQTYGAISSVVPNVIDYYRFHQAAPSIKTDKLKIIFLGRLVERKGCRYLLEAVQSIVASGAVVPAFEVVIGGKGELEGELRQYVRRNKLDKIVSFIGFISEADKPSFYASADIAVFPSTGGESFGIVLIEAMASGRSAVLAGHNSGYATVMAPQPDLLFTATDTTELAAKLELLLTDAARREAMALWGMEYSRGFDVDTVGAAIEAEYERALHKRRSS